MPKTKPEGKCDECDGTGRVHSHNDTCWDCDGAGKFGPDGKPAYSDKKVIHVEQPMPTKNAGPCIQDLVIADIEKRKEIGLQRYGTLLQPFNGRDALRDAYEEALDLCQYLRQAIVERDVLLASAEVNK